MDNSDQSYQLTEKIESQRGQIFKSLMTPKEAFSLSGTPDFSGLDNITNPDTYQKRMLELDIKKQKQIFEQQKIDKGIDERDNFFNQVSEQYQYQFHRKKDQEEKEIIMENNKKKHEKLQKNQKQNDKKIKQLKFKTKKYLSESVMEPYKNDKYLYLKKFEKILNNSAENLKDLQELESELYQSQQEYDNIHIKQHQSNNWMLTQEFSEQKEKAYEKIKKNQEKYKKIDGQYYNISSKKKNKNKDFVEQNINALQSNVECAKYYKFLGYKHERQIPTRRNPKEVLETRFLFDMHKQKVNKAVTERQNKIKVLQHKIKKEKEAEKEKEIEKQRAEQEQLQFYHNMNKSKRLQSLPSLKERFQNVVEKQLLLKTQQSQSSLEMSDNLSDNNSIQIQKTESQSAGRSSFLKNAINSKKKENEQNYQQQPAYHLKSGYNKIVKKSLNNTGKNFYSNTMLDNNQHNITLTTNASQQHIQTQNNGNQSNDNIDLKRYDPQNISGFQNYQQQQQQQYTPIKLTDSKTLKTESTQKSRQYNSIESLASDVSTPLIKEENHEKSINESSFESQQSNNNIINEEDSNNSGQYSSSEESSDSEVQIDIKNLNEEQKQKYEKKLIELQKQNTEMVHEKLKNIDFQKITLSLNNLKKGSISNPKITINDKQRRDSSRSPQKQQRDSKLLGLNKRGSILVQNTDTFKLNQQNINKDIVKIKQSEELLYKLPANKPRRSVLLLDDQFLKSDQRFQNMYDFIQQKKKDESITYQQFKRNTVATENNNFLSVNNNNANNIIFEQTNRSQNSNQSQNKRGSQMSQISQQSVKKPKSPLELELEKLISEEERKKDQEIDPQLLFYLREIQARYSQLNSKICDEILRILRSNRQQSLYLNKKSVTMDQQLNTKSEEFHKFQNEMEASETLARRCQTISQVLSKLYSKKKFDAVKYFINEENWIQHMIFTNQYNIETNKKIKKLKKGIREYRSKKQEYLSEDVKLESKKSQNKDQALVAIQPDSQEQINHFLKVTQGETPSSKFLKNKEVGLEDFKNAYQNLSRQQTVDHSIILEKE